MRFCNFEIKLDFFFTESIINRKFARISIEIYDEMLKYFPRFGKSSKKDKNLNPSRDLGSIVGFPPNFTLVWQLLSGYMTKGGGLKNMCTLVPKQTHFSDVVKKWFFSIFPNLWWSQLDLDFGQNMTHIIIKSTPFSKKNVYASKMLLDLGQGVN